MSTLTTSTALQVCQLQREQGQLMVSRMAVVWFKQREFLLLPSTNKCIRQTYGSLTCLISGFPYPVAGRPLLLPHHQYSV